MKMMNNETVGKGWRESFFHVDQWGRSSFRLLLIGSSFLAVWWVSALVGVPFGVFRAIRAFGVLGIIFVIVAGVGPSLEIVIRKMTCRKKSK